jgi:t-SNARE complex subunit (syntaxin)
MRRGELSKFVEEAVQRQLFRVMVDDIQLRNATVNKGQLQADIDRAVKEVRAESKMRLQPRKNSRAKTIAVA